MAETVPVEGRRRVVIENVKPVIDCGRYPIKRTLDQHVTVTADVFADGHDLVCCALLFRKPGASDWQQLPMEPLGNDAWRSQLTLEELGLYQYTVEGWIDTFGSWYRDLQKRLDAGQDVSVDLLIGRDLVAAAAAKASSADKAKLTEWKSRLADAGGVERVRSEGDALAELMRRNPDKQFASRYDTVLGVTVDRERARFSSWYEMFPRSTASESGRHGTFRDCIARLPYVADLGFDVLYLPPIHPIGRAFRKGKNNALEAQPGEPGSPWAIGGKEGGHQAIHPDLGTLADFHMLVAAAREYDIDIALDIAYQCSPDHPYVREHPEWFRKRPDGTIQHAENPPKKYQDIYPFDFETKAWRGLWEELRDVVVYWIEQGVHVFRVDNPHTKSLGFWEWMIADVKRQYPDVIFLSEAFTRPKIMYRLAKVGFSQSYTYFTWRYSKQEFVEYLTELTTPPLQEFFRPNFWPNTPDILPEHLQTGGRPAFVTRVVMAGTLAANYGIYGPAFELMEHVPREHGSEEYLNSEKYEIRHWDLERSSSLREVLKRLNQARRDNPALKANLDLTFHDIDNDQILCYSKYSKEFKNLVLVAVNLDFRAKQGGNLLLPLEKLGLDAARPYELRDVLTESTFEWRGARNYVELDPETKPVHLFVVRQ